ncbi:electron transport complex subunit RsxC [Chitinilyticum litopenaei]|uniref:electron transport complex subunit RsxC n=1 Tax=Chitinilyticum litopenaei TaxID=1121276 RepID=UPI0009DBA778|nr:electron transport complex subunit RsxC [Chitinilyticum litopenaei]
MNAPAKPQAGLPANTQPVYRFSGGVHPPEMKHLSNQTPIVAAPLPARLVVPLQQSIGNRAKCLVNVGDEVKKGQLLAAADGTVSVAVHAPTSGRVVAIDAQVVAHPSGLAELCVTIDSDGRDEWGERSTLDWRSLLASGDRRTIRDYLRDMGVVGLGGAVFPSHLKLSGRDGLDTLVINGAECEPFITCDDRLMRERASDIAAGIAIVAQLLGARQVLVGIEDNKPEAVLAMREALATSGLANAHVVVVPTLYPSGGAKQLIKLLTNKEVPSGVRSTDLGVQCFNVATVYTIYRALEHAEPVISRIVTLTGNVSRAGNVEALIGTPIAELLNFAGDLGNCEGYIYGGPMMGFELPDTSVGLTKAGNCVIARSPAHFQPKQPEMPCIRCGECAVACPQELQPMDLYWFARSKNFGKAQEWNLFDCIECGACAYVCPSSIQLVDYYRFAKSEIWAAESAKKAADLARQRHEFKQFREEREKEEKAARLAARAAPKPEAAPALDDDKAAKIKAAMERAAAAKAGAGSANAAALTPNPLPEGEGDGQQAAPAVALADDKAAKIRAAMEAAAAKKAARAAADAGGATPEAKPAHALDEEKAAKIRAVMEAAKARKAAAEGAVTETAAPSAEAKPAIDPEKAAKIRAAMEAAKAKKEGRAPAETTPADTPVVDAPASKGQEGLAVDTPAKPAIDPEKAAKIRAAMEAAKARKEGRAPVETPPADTPVVDAPASKGQDGLAADTPVAAPAEPATKPALDPEKAAKIRAAMEAAKARKEGRAPVETPPADTPVVDAPASKGQEGLAADTPVAAPAETPAKPAIDPDKAAKIRAAMEAAKARKAAKEGGDA